MLLGSQTVPAAQERLQCLQQPVAEEMRQVAQRFKADELAIVRDFMRQAKEVFERQVSAAFKEDAGSSHGDAGGAGTKR